jgi:hypothetical protein
MTDEFHVSQQQLRDVEGIDDILNELSVWLTTAKFENGQRDVQKCLDQGLPKALQTLRRATDLCHNVFRYLAV